MGAATKLLHLTRTDRLAESMWYTMQQCFTNAKTYNKHHKLDGWSELVASVSRTRNRNIDTLVGVREVKVIAGEK